MEIINIDGQVVGDDSSEKAEDAPKASFVREFASHNPHKITDLKPAVHNQNRINVFLGSTFAFSLDISQVVDFHLKVGKTLTSKEIKDLEHASEFGKLYSRTLEWVLTRPRSVKETRDHLQKKLKLRELNNMRCQQNAARVMADPELAKNRAKLHLKTHELKLYSEADIEAVITKLLKKGYLNDYTFARWYIDNRFVKKGISRAKLSQELTQKGIDRTTINELLNASGRTDETEIKKIIIKKSARLEPSKLLRYLVSHGFPYDLSYELVKAYTSNPESFSQDV
ncbi:RecX family transcriptional regulator [Candidatus Saccharibacteria bacterium]|nr:RecX family transcriptional regulator [Candidatus Saccharibacteria bacterium]